MICKLAAVPARRECFEAHDVITREIGNRAYAIYRQPWRLFRNRRLRQEIRELDRQAEAVLAELPPLRRRRPAPGAISHEPPPGGPHGSR